MKMKKQMKKMKMRIKKIKTQKIFKKAKKRIFLFSKIKE